MGKKPAALSKKARGEAIARARARLDARSYTSPGAWLWVHDLHDPAAPHAKEIQEAFKAAGWYFDGQAHPDLLEAGEIMIAVSSHP
jgi:hypothetical protein